MIVALSPSSFTAVLEGRRGKLGGIEEVFAAQMLVALGVIGVDAVGGDLDLHLGGFRLGLVERERSLERVEAAVQPTEAEVLDLPVDEGVRLVGIDDEIGGAGRRRRQQGGDEGERGGGQLHTASS